jgi:hypothetical protein
VSLDKHTSTFVCTCDTCGQEELDTDDDSFMFAVEAVKKAGWRIRKDKTGEWTHECPTCREIYGTSLFENVDE